MTDEDGQPIRAFRRPIELSLYAAAPAATLVTAPLLAQGLGPVQRGQYGLAVAIATLALTVGSWGQADVRLGMATSGGSHYPAHRAIALVGGVVAGVACGGFLLLLGLQPATAAVSALTVPALSTSGLWQAEAIRSGALRPLALSNVAVAALRVLAFLALVASGTMRAPTAVAAFQMSLLVGLLLTVGLAIKNRAPDDGGPRAWSAMLSAGAGITAFNAANALLQRADLVVLQIRATPLDLGLYAAPASLTTAALALSAAFKPRVQGAIIRGNSSAVVSREFLRMLVLAVVGVTALWFMAPMLVGLLFGPQFAGSMAPLRILALAIVPLLVVDLVYGVFVALGRVRALVGLATIGAVLSTSLLWLLAPTFGAVGAAGAVAVSYAVTGVLGVAMANRFLGRSSP